MQGCAWGRCPISDLENVKGWGLTPSTASGLACDVEYVYGDLRLQRAWWDWESWRHYLNESGFANFIDRYGVEGRISELLIAGQRLEAAIWYYWLWSARLQLAARTNLPIVELRKSPKLLGMTQADWPSVIEPGLYQLVPKRWWEQLNGGSVVFDKWHTADDHEQFMHAHRGAANRLHVNIDPGEAADLCFD